MATYAVSDLHGLKLDLLKQLLVRADFTARDWLFILGDVIDRQNDGGVEILKWLLEQPNAQLILGNHESMLLSCSFLFQEITEQSVEQFDNIKMDLLLNYIGNGGEVTLKALRQLRSRDPELLEDILDYLRDAPVYEAVSVGERNFLLVHGGLGNFHPKKKMTDYTVDQLIWASPRLDETYFNDIITVFGHTPTLMYGEEYAGKILKTETWIDIDVGVHCGNPPALLRLDDLKEFYLTE